MHGPAHAIDVAPRNGDGVPAAPSVTPGLSGSPSVATPEPALASIGSECPW